MVLFITAAVLFKIDFLVELGISLLFPKGKRHNVNFELKSGFIHLLPTFNGLVGEDPHTHLKEFHMVCVGMKPNGVDEEHVKLKAFPFSLKGAAKTWLFSILPGSIGTWNGMKKIFLEKYFLASRVANIRK